MLKNIINLNKKISELKKEKEEIFREYRGAWSAYHDEKYKNLSNKIERLETEKDVEKNNIYKKVYDIFVSDIESILLKYKDKKIGEKTSEKISEEIKQAYKNKGINVSSYIYLYNENNFEYSDNVNIRILNDEGFTYYDLQACKIDYYYGGEEKQGHFTGKRCIPQLTEKDAKTEAERISTEKEKAEKEIKELEDKIEVIRKKFNDTLEGETYNNYYIKA